MTSGRALIAAPLGRRRRRLRTGAARPRLRRGHRAGRGARLLDDPGPALAAAENPHAAFELEGIRPRQRDTGFVEAAILGIVDLSFPLVRLALFNPDQDRRAEQRLSALGRVGMMGIDAGLLLPVDAAPIAVGARLDPDSRRLVGDHPDPA